MKRCWLTFPCGSCWNNASKLQCSTAVSPTATVVLSQMCSTELIIIVGSSPTLPANTISCHYTVAMVTVSASSLQRGRIACNTKRCISHRNSVRLSVRLLHAGTLPIRMKLGLCGLHCRVIKHSSFLTPTIIGGDVPFHLKFALIVTHPL